MSWLLGVFRVLSACTSTLMILSLMPTVYQIHKTHTTGHTPITPMVTMLVNCHLWMLYGYLDGIIFPVFTTFLVGVFISLGYIAVYYRWTDDRTRAHKLFAFFGTLLTLVTAYAVVGLLGYTNQSRSQVTAAIGYIGIAAALMLYSSPFEKVGQVFKYKSAVFIPIHMVTAGTINNATWVIYSAMTRNWFILVPNVVIFTMGLVQVALYFVFHPSTHPLPADYELAMQGKVDLELDASMLEGGVVAGAAGAVASPSCSSQARKGDFVVDGAPSYLPLHSPLEPLHRV